MHVITQTFKQIGFFTIALTLALVANFAYGQWANPTATPVGGNITAPINTSGQYQEKYGNIGLGQLRAADRVRSDLYCDYNPGTTCFTSQEVRNVVDGGGGGGGLGEGQTWQNMMSSRGSGVWYRNTTGKPIQIYINHNSSGNGGAYVRCSTCSTYVQVAHFDDDAENAYFIVPDRDYYTISSGNISRWSELR